MHKLASTFNLTTIACKFSTVLLWVIKLLTRSDFQFCFLHKCIQNCIILQLTFSGVLACCAVLATKGRLIIYCKDQHSSQCCNWKLYWSCKYSSLFFAVTGGSSVFLHLAQYRHYSPGFLSSRGLVTQTAPKLAMENNKRKAGNIGHILFHAQVLSMLHSLVYSSGRSIEHQQRVLRNGQQHILFTTLWK